MVKVLQNVPSDFVDFVAGVDHVDSCLDAVLDLEGQNAGVPVKVLCFALESVESVGVL